jgi:hypothetical protein
MLLQQQLLAVCKLNCCSLNSVCSAMQQSRGSSRAWWTYRVQANYMAAQACGGRYMRAILRRRTVMPLCTPTADGCSIP